MSSTLIGNMTSSRNDGRENMATSERLDEKENSVRNSRSIHVSGKPSSDVSTAIADPSHSALKENNNNILDQSKKLVGFLGGSIMTALNNQGAFASKKWLDSNNNNNFPSNGQSPTGDLQTAVPDSQIEKTTINQADHQKTMLEGSHQNDEESPGSQPKQKYWETLMLPSEDSDPIFTQDDVQKYNESPSPSCQLPKKEKISTLVSPQGKKLNIIDDKYEGKDSPESTLSIPGDYSPGGSTFSIKPTPNTGRIKNWGNNSPESLLCNMISAATTLDTPLLLKSGWGPQQKENELAGDGDNGNRYSPKIKAVTSSERKTPASLMADMISTATSAETPLVYMSGVSRTQNPDDSIAESIYTDKNSPQNMASIHDDHSQQGEGLQGGHSRQEKSPGSLMYNMISSATALENPVVLMNGKGIAPDASPLVSNFRAKPTVTRGDPSNEAFKSKQESGGDNHVSVNHDVENSNKENQSASDDNGCKALDKTPVKSNKSQVARSTKSIISLESDCDESEDVSIYTSMSYQSIIRSIVPMEWVGPDTSNEIAFPVSASVGNEKTSAVPGRRFRITKPSANAGKHFMPTQKKARPKSSCWVPRLKQVGNSSSPTSLPSLLGAASLNEVSDLESPNIIMPPMNFKFSDEESTIESQSMNEASEIHSIPGDERCQRAPSPHSLMTVDIDEQTLGSSTDEKFAHTAINSAAVSNTTSKGSRSPHSTITNESFGQGVQDKMSASSKWLRRCISLGMMMAIFGGITVLIISLIDRAKPEEPMRRPNIDEDWASDIDFDTPNAIDLSVPTASPTVTFSPSVEGTHNGTEFTSSPTNSPTPYPASQPEKMVNPSPEPVLKPVTKIDASSKPTLTPVTAVDASSKPTSTPVTTVDASSKPTSTPLITGEVSSKPTSTGDASSKLTSRPVTAIDASSKPTSPPVKAGDSSSKPTSPPVKAGDSSSKPTSPSVTTGDLSSKPTSPPVTTVDASSKPTTTPLITGDASSKPTSTGDASSKSTSRPVTAIDASSKPTSPPVKAGDSFSKPTSPPVTTGDSSSKPTSRPVTLMDASSKPTAKPNLQPAPSPLPTRVVEQSLPTDSLEPPSESTSEPTLKPTSKPVILPTFTTEKLQELTWDQTIKGEDIWRESVDKRTKTPLWYFAADVTTGMKIKVVNAARGDRVLNQLRVTVDDYGKSNAVSSLELTTVDYEFLCTPPAIGHIKVCSGDFGYESIGSSILFMRGDYIVSALIRINEHASSPAGDALLQYSLCHQFGHALGVPHNTVGGPFSSCMKDFDEDIIVDGKIIQVNEKLQHPNLDDLDSLVTIYGLATTRRLRGSESHI